MAKRLLITLAIMALIILSLGYFKTKQFQAAAAAFSFQPPPEAVTTVVVKKATWPSTVNVVGTMVAIHGVNVSADLPGTVDRINFESGRFVQKGDLLVELDTRQERA